MNDPAARYQQLGNLVATMPNLQANGWATPEGRLWLGRLSALVEAEPDVNEMVALRSATDHLGGPLPSHVRNVQQIISILHRALARAELAAPVAAQGSFIPVGASHTAVVMLVKIFETATASVLIVDPYADANLLTTFALLVPEGKRVMVLADKAGHKAALQPAAKAWVEQYGQTRPLEVRLAPEGHLHDRLIIIDDRGAWTVGQSFNSLAKRAPTSMVPADQETANAKVAAYRLIWMTAGPLL